MKPMRGFRLIGVYKSSPTCGFSKEQADVLRDHFDYVRRLEPELARERALYGKGGLMRPPEPSRGEPPPKPIHWTDRLFAHPLFWAILASLIIAAVVAILVPGPGR